MRIISRLVLATLCASAGCTADDPGSVEPPPLGTESSALASTLVSRHGGPVLAHPKVVIVNWSGSVDATIRNSMSSFFSTLLASSYMSWTSEYGVGPGTVAGQVTIAPVNPSKNLTRDDRDPLHIIDDIGAELDRQIPSHLPVPDADTVYVVYFPPGYTLNLDGVQSCQPLGFCGYHQQCTTPTCSRTITYAVLPDLGCSACLQGLAKLDATTIVSSHELIEAATDPAVPTGWIPEVADLCTNVSTNHSGSTSQNARVGSFMVQKSWSNLQGNCTAVPNATGAIGQLDGIDAHGTATGWACDPDSPTAAVTVTLYAQDVIYPIIVTDRTMVSGGRLAAQTIANQPSEAAVNSACLGGTAHRFSLQLSAATPGQPFWAGAIDTTSASTYFIGTHDLPASQITLAVAPNQTYYFSDPTPPNVARDEDILIRNLGAGDLRILNPSALVTGSCIQQNGTGPSTIGAGATGLLHVRLLCGSSTTATGTVSIQHNSPALIPGTSTPIPNPYTFPIQGQVAPGMPFDIRLDATYQTSAGAPRSLFETRQAHPDAAVSFAYDDRSTGANFEQRPGGACPAFGLTNTWFSLSLRGNASISSCRFQDSWDPTELPCPTSAIDAFNQGREIIINTDSFAINPSTCAPFQFPSVTHVPVGTPVFMRILFDVGGMTYVRGVNFIKHP